MKAVTWHGPEDVRVESVPDPVILNPQDGIVRVTSTAICGSDLHLYHGYVPSMRSGDILGHEFMGEVVEVGSAVSRVTVGDRVVIPFAIACGRCGYCRRGEWSLCDNSNPNAEAVEAMYGFSSAGLFGYSHLFGGYAGGQAEYVRVPFIDVGALEVPRDVTDDKVLFLGDVLPTGWMAAELCDIKPGDSVAVWGCGPVGQFAIRSAFLLGADRVFAIDRVAERLVMAAAAGAEPIDDREDIVDELKARTAGRGPDACIDAVGMEAHGGGLSGTRDRVMHALRIGSDRGAGLRSAIQACRKGGNVAIAGVYSGYLDAFPIGAAFEKGLTIRGGQTPVHRYMRPLLARVLEGEIAPEAIITHRMRLEDAPDGYRRFRDKEDGCIKVVLSPAA
ncbi:MAG TPA: zinc-dependent alcohol dehydrogenase [Candidatus Limnocylindrales bacterium]